MLSHLPQKSPALIAIHANDEPCLMQLICLCQIQLKCEGLKFCRDCDVLKEFSFFHLSCTRENSKSHRSVLIFYQLVY